MFDSNPRITQAKKEKKVPNWQIADAIGCHENTVIHMLRHPLTEQQTETMIRTIEQIAESRAEA